MSPAVSIRCFVICALACAGISAHAESDLWRIQEVFSDSTGAVQYIELTTTEPNEFLVSNHALTVTSDGVPMTLVLNHNLTGQASTANRTFLVATSGFTALDGSVTPDFTIPSSFFNPNANWISVDFAGIDSLSFSGAILPKDGLYSLVDHNPAGVAHVLAEINSPQNFAGATGSINAAPTPLAADFDLSGQVDNVDLAYWQFGFGKAAGATRFDGDANNDMAVDGDDFLVWQRQLQQPLPPSAANASPVAEPTSAALAAIMLAGAVGSVRRLTQFTGGRATASSSRSLASK